MVIHQYHADSTYILCDVCGVELGEIFSPSPSSHQIIFLHSCNHYEWEGVGLLCWEDPSSSDICTGVESMIHDHAFHVEDGGNVYVLVPRSLP
jgi:hypothetical protein